VERANAVSAACIEAYWRRCRAVFIHAAPLFSSGHVNHCRNEIEPPLSKERDQPITSEWEKDGS
jgi:hypothetical protein